MAARGNRGLIYAALFFVTFSWALNTVIVKYAITLVDPLAFTGLRFLAMTPLGFLLALMLRQPIRLRKRDLAKIIVCAACGYGLYQYFWVFGLAHTTAFASSLFASLSPLTTLTLVASLGHERVHRFRWAGAVVALAGVAVFEGLFAGHVTFRIGDLLTFGAAMLFAVFNVLSARLLRVYSPVGLVAISILFGTLILLPGAVPALIAHPLWRAPLIVWAIFAYAVTFPILLTFPAWTWVIGKIGAGRASLFQFAVPVMAGFLAILLLHEQIEPHQIAGTAICIAGMALAQRNVLS